MTAVPLRLGPIAIAGHRVVRSAVRWLCADGHAAQAGEAIAYCNIGVIAADGSSAFAHEARDLQVAFAPRVAGRVRRSGEANGGFLDRLNTYRWTDDFSFGAIEPAAAVDDPGLPRLLFLAGRRMSEIVEERSGLLTGWHDRARGWWGDGGATKTLLCLGTCELSGAVRGERGAFLELFAADIGAAQVGIVQGEPLVPSVRVLIEQIARTPAAMRAIAADAAASFAAGSIVPAPADWLFVGALLAGLARTPIGEGFRVIDRAGLWQAPPPAAIALSLTAELPPTLRHRRLGYAIACHPFRLAQTGPALRAWLTDNFEPVARTTADVADEFRRLAAAVRATTGAALLVANSVSTQAYEDILHYAGFDLPLGDTLASVRAKERNAMLDDLAGDEAGIAVVDVDAIVADLGMWTHLPDGLHPSGAVQAAVRAEMIALLRERGIV